MGYTVLNYYTYYKNRLHVCMKGNMDKLRSRKEDVHVEVNVE